MYVFCGAFTANSKKTNAPFYVVELFERRVNQNSAEVYFKSVRSFVEKPVYEKITKSNFKFGDVVELQKVAPRYFGGQEQLTGLKLVLDSPYYDLEEPSETASK